jgi:hypothetical protein
MLRRGLRRRRRMQLLPLVVLLAIAVIVARGFGRL